MGEIIPQVLNGTTNGLHKGKRKLWTHPDPESTRMAEFKRGVNKKYGLKLKNYDDLYKWSIDDIGSFWGEVWDFTGITASKHYDKVRKSSRDQISSHGLFMLKRLSRLSRKELLSFLDQNSLLGRGSATLRICCIQPISKLTRIPLQSLKLRKLATMKSPGQICESESENVH
jgi:hypothetical protein